MTVNLGGRHLAAPTHPVARVAVAYTLILAAATVAAGAAALLTGGF